MTVTTLKTNHPSLYPCAVIITHNTSIARCPWHDLAESALHKKKYVHYTVLDISNHINTTSSTCIHTSTQQSKTVTVQKRCFTNRERSVLWKDVFSDFSWRKVVVNQCLEIDLLTYSWYLVRPSTFLVSRVVGAVATRGLVTHPPRRYRGVIISVLII